MSLNGFDNNMMPEKAPREQKSGSSAGKIAALALSFSLMGALIGGGGVAIYTHLQTERIRKEAVAAAKKEVRANDKDASSDGSVSYLSGDKDVDGDPLSAQESSFDTTQLHTASEIYEAYVNSTVGINTKITQDYYGYEATGEAAGSGFILSEDGYIVTNYHVIEDATEVSVTTFDGKIYDAEIIGFDESNDLAVLKIEADDLTPVVIGDSDEVKVGDDVLAIGNPLGELSFSLTKGCISALERSVIVEDKPMTLFQTDCAINAGNSGGALFDMYGRVIGITNAKYSRSAMSSEASIENIGFAIPINSVSSIITDIIEKGYISKPFIGVMCQTVDSKMQGLGLPSGVSIEEVIDGGPAEAAGILPNDIITAVNGKAISSTDDLKREIKNAGIGGKLTLTIYRQGDVLDIDVDVVEQQVSALGDTDG